MQGGTKIARAVQRQQELLADVQQRFQAMYGGGVVAVSEQDGSLNKVDGALQRSSGAGTDVGCGAPDQAGVSSAHCQHVCRAGPPARVWEDSPAAVMLDLGHHARPTSALGRSACPMSVAACGVCMGLLACAAGHCSYSTACRVLLAAPWLQCHVCSGESCCRCQGCQSRQVLRAAQPDVRPLLCLQKCHGT